MERSTTNLFISLGLMALVALGCVAPPSGRESRQSSHEPPSTPASRQSSHEPTSNPTNESVETTDWQYHEEPDKMGRGIIKFASVPSSNTVSFDFPYQGEQQGRLTLRTHPEHGKDVILSVEKGQFLTGIDGCRVQVRFDSNKPVYYWARGPASHSTTSIFLDGYSKFVSSLKRAKKVSIEAPFYREGDQVFEFNVGNLEWEDSKTEKAK